MTRDQFIAKYLDETVGLLVAAFARSEKNNHRMGEQAFADDGRFMLDQMRRAKDLLGRMYDELKPIAPESNGTKASGNHHPASGARPQATAGANR